MSNVYVSEIPGESLHVFSNKNLAVEYAFGFQPQHVRVSIMAELLKDGYCTLPSDNGDITVSKCFVNSVPRIRVRTVEKAITAEHGEKAEFDYYQGVAWFYDLRGGRRRLQVTVKTVNSLKLAKWTEKFRNFWNDKTVGEYF